MLLRRAQLLVEQIQPKISFAEPMSDGDVYTLLRDFPSYWRMPPKHGENSENLAHCANLYVGDESAAKIKKSKECTITFRKWGYLVFYFYRNWYKPESIEYVANECYW